MASITLVYFFIFEKFVKIFAKTEVFCKKNNKIINFKKKRNYRLGKNRPITYMFLQKVFDKNFLKRSELSKYFVQIFSPKFPGLYYSNNLAVFL